MANNYTYFSMAFPLKGKKAKEWVEKVLRKADELSGDSSEDKWFQQIFPRWGDYLCTGFDWSIDGTSLWLRDSGGEANIDAVASFLRAYLKKFDPGGKIGFHFANTCSSQRVDEFGGGACVVTAKKQKWLDTFSWLTKKLDK